MDASAIASLRLIARVASCASHCGCHTVGNRHRVLDPFPTAQILEHSSPRDSALEEVRAGADRPVAATQQRVQAERRRALDHAVTLEGICGDTERGAVRD